MKLIADTHTHTIAGGHAYSTITENCSAAAQKGLRFLGITEHASSMEGAPVPLFFSNLKILPEQMNSVWLLRGVELNIINFEGGVDLPAKIYEGLDWVIASMHTICLPPSSKTEHTTAWLAIAENPGIDVIGHCGDPRFIFDFETVIPVFGQCGKIVEINTHSFRGRAGSLANCTRIAELCARHGVRVVVNSDAHFHNRIGDFDSALDMLASIGFPNELIINADYDRFAAIAAEKSGRLFPAG
ncbi:MAG: phosphatase [Treponema sp.]|jgi:putative hydrolase|nr:phosphatase [Treponema sp.]